MSSSDYDADLLKSSGAGMIRKTGLRYHDFFEVLCPSAYFRILPESSRAAGMSRPSLFMSLRTPLVAVDPQRTGGCVSKWLLASCIPWAQKA